MITARIHLPEFYNKERRSRRKRVEEGKFKMVAEELAARFGGGTWKSGATGVWADPSDGIVYHDNLRILEVGMKDTKTNKGWIRRYVRETLKSRFEQKAIYLVFTRDSQEVL